MVAFVRSTSVREYIMLPAVAMEIHVQHHLQNDKCTHPVHSPVGVGVGGMKLIISLTFLSCMNESSKALV